MTVATQPNVPVVDGTVDTWDVSPALPAGLTLDAVTGEISGQPTGVAQRTIHTVTASNADGSVSFDVEIEVVEPPRFAYVTNLDDTISITSMDPASGRLIHEGFLAMPADQLGPREIVVHPSGEWAYVASFDGGRVSVLEIDTATGALTPGLPAVAGSGTYGLALSPDGNFLYASSEVSGDVHAFSVDQVDGSLTAVGAPALAQSQPRGIAVDPAGDFVYVVNNGSSSISIFEIQGDGSLLSNVAPVGFPGRSPRSIAIEPSGLFAYVVTENDDMVTPFTIDRTTGELQALSGGQLTGTLPSSVTVDPTGQFTYVTNASSATITTFGIDAAGDLAAVGSVPAGQRPVEIQFDPSGAFAYVVNQNSKDLTIHSVDPATGELTEAGIVRARDPLFVAVAQGPTAVQRSTQYAYVLTPDATPAPQVRAFSVDSATGDLTWIDDATTAASPSGLALSPDGSHAWVVHSSNNTVVAYEIDSLTGELFLDWFTNPLDNAIFHDVVIDPTGRFMIALATVFFAPPAGNPVDSVVVFEIGFRELTLVGGGAVEDGARTLELDPTGRVVAVSIEGSNRVGTFEFDPSNGMVQRTAGIDVQAAGGPTSVTYDASGRFLYSTLAASNELVQYAVDPVTGDLTRAGTSVSILSAPLDTALHPNGRLAFVAVNDPLGSGHVEVLSLDPVSGQATREQSVLAGTNPHDVRLDATGTVLYVVNEGSDDVSVFTVDPQTGDLTPRLAAPTGDMPDNIVLKNRLQ